MTKTATNNFARIALALLAAIAAVVAGVNASGAGAATATTLGKTKSTPAPLCPGGPCKVTAKVTGFQRSADDRGNLFKVDQDGKIVAWSIEMGNPAKEDRQTFGDLTESAEFGKKPTAGISIIRKTDSKKYKLKSNSPVLTVNSYYGEEPIFVLDQPLNVRKDDIVALSTVTWLPTFAEGPSTSGDKWVGSRSSDNCGTQSDPIDLDESSAHRNVGSERRYECTYRDARILYKAYFVKD